MNSSERHKVKVRLVSGDVYDYQAESWKFTDRWVQLILPDHMVYIATDQIAYVAVPTLADSTEGRHAPENGVG